MTELEKLQKQIIEMNDLIKQNDQTIQDLNQEKETFKEEKKILENDLEDLRKLNKNYFERLITQDKLFQQGNKVDKDEDLEKSPINWNDLF